MPSLIQTITDLASPRIGINIFETMPVGSVSGRSTNTVAIVGQFPWGPVDEVTQITDTATFFSTFCPLEFEALADYSAMDCLLNKGFSGTLKVVRISPSALDTADSGALTAGTGTITITAAYAGALGNDIEYQFTTATDGDAAKRDLYIRIGTSYQVQYKNVTHTTITSIDNPFVVITAAAPSALPTAGSSTALTGGVDGTATAADFTGGTGNLVGVELFKASSFDILFCAEVPSGILDTVNTNLDTFASSIDSGIVLLNTPTGQSASTAETYVTSYRSPRCVYVWPLVYTVDTYDSTNPEILVQGNSFVAAALSKTAPEASIMAGAGSTYFSGITDVETDTTTTDLHNLVTAGVTAFLNEKQLGIILYKDVTTSVTAGEERVLKRRMQDYIQEAISRYSLNFVGKRLDIDVTAQTMGSVTSALAGQLKQFFTDLVTNERIESFELDFYSNSTPTDISNGVWKVGVSVDLYAPIESIVFVSTFGF